MRATYPVESGQVERDGLKLGFEVFGQGDPTILLLPTWTIIHSRFWKMQVPYLSRYYQVVTYDGPGNGRSDRVTDPARYSVESYAADAVAVLDACDVESAVVVGLSMGGQYGTRLADLYPERVRGLALIGPALALGDPLPERAGIVENFHRPYPEDPRGWDKYNLAYWHDHYQDFAEFFFGQIFVEAHSTKPIEDAVRWALEGGPAMLEAEAARPRPQIPDSEVFTKINCPVMIFHGTEDRIQPHQTGEEAARLSQGTLSSMIGSGHMPNVRDPVKVNLALRDFVERLGQ